MSSPIFSRAQDIAPDQQVALNALKSLAENHFKSMFSALKVAAMTEQARSGEWEKIEPLLIEVQGFQVPCAAWFVRTDGSYCTVDHGPETNNLSDRSYFSSILDGQNVMASLVVSKSTGKNSAVVAVPIIRQGQVIGALGASVFLDKLSALIRDELGLPDDRVFFALDANKMTVLNWKQERIFLDPSQQGSESLARAVDQMLAGESGVVDYEFHGPRRVAFTQSTVLRWWFAMGNATP